MRACVRTALERYFASLDGEDPGGLYDMVMREVEAPLLEVVMREARGNQTRAAEILGISRATLRRKLRAHGLL
ncbi:MAG TPA: Fis family transcriptional regulator [Chromatiales bacterium]|nr:Fis family transcriptional regulator [Chromatiales bacterium]